MTDFKLGNYPLRSTEKLRYRDMDTQGHVNNAVFSTLFEAARVETFYNPQKPLTEPNHYFVVARISIDFLGELIWPGEVEIGTRIASVGRSSMKIEQVLFQNGRCAASAETVVVQMDKDSRSSCAIPAVTREKLTPFLPQSAAIA
ncbi:MAG: acyl-CoA thioesterase [Phyllobacterium sp.]